MSFVMVYLHILAQFILIYYYFFTFSFLGISHDSSSGTDIVLCTPFQPSFLGRQNV